MAGITSVNVLRPAVAGNAAGSADPLIYQALLVDIQPADDDPHERDPGWGAPPTAALKTWWDVFCDVPPLPVLYADDRLIDFGESDPLTGTGYAEYRVRRVRAWEDHVELRCERAASQPSS